MLTITGVGREFTMTPGEWRSRPEHDVAVGRHQPPSSASVDDFMRHFAQRYRFEGIGRASRIMALAATHHRFNYIHPFPDGNGRVSRLMSHAMAWRADVAAHGLWSISRGLAHGLESRTEYKQMMDVADTPRQGDLDGRGNLSERFPAHTLDVLFPRLYPPRVEGQHLGCMSVCATQAPSNSGQDLYAGARP